MSTCSVENMFVFHKFHNFFLLFYHKLILKRVGYGGHYDLRLLDNGTSGAHHSGQVREGVL